MNEQKTYLFSYPFQGKLLSIEILATSQVEAKAKLVAMQKAQYDGVLMKSFSVSSQSWLAKLIFRLFGKKC